MIHMIISWHKETGSSPENTQHKFSIEIIYALPEEIIEIIYVLPEEASSTLTSNRWL